MKGTYTYQAEDYEATIKDLSLVNVNVITHKVLETGLLKMTHGFPKGEDIDANVIDEHREVEISIKEYQTLCGIKDTKEARKQLSEGTKDLYEIAELNWTEERYEIPKGKKRKTKVATKWKARILDTIGDGTEQNPVQNGKVTMKFSFDVAKYFSKTGYIMPYNMNLLKINGKLNPHSYYMGRKLLDHHNQNIAKENANRISVKTLIAACPDLPSYEEVMKKGKHATQQIIDPFDRDMLALKCNKYSILSDWHYCNSKGEPLTAEQVTKYDYHTWIEWLIEFQLADYPDQSNRIAKIEKRKTIAASRKKQTKQVK